MFSKILIASDDSPLSAEAVSAAMNIIPLMVYR
jgi:hypothetical protein